MSLCKEDSNEKDLDFSCLNLSQELSYARYIPVSTVTLSHTKYLHMPYYGVLLSRSVSVIRKFSARQKPTIKMAEQLPAPPSYAEVFESADPPGTDANAGNSDDDDDGAPDPPTVDESFMTMTVPRCGCPIKKRRDQFGRWHKNCRWSELECPWVYHAEWRQSQGRKIVILQPCPSHPKCLVALCREGHEPEKRK